MRRFLASNTEAEYVITVDKHDYDKVAQFSWYFDVARRRVIAQILNKTVPLQNYVMGCVVCVFDHIDRNSLNNRRENLRQATLSQNNANRGFFKNNSSGFKGVNRSSSKSKPWRAGLMINNQRINLGNFSTKEAAAQAYDQKAVEVFGVFACTNQMLGLY